ncbi:serine/threonine-protein kinase [Pseudanabaena sp. PCC 6802]|uniref:serine/threonine-protein kinase n=1 Tax=Pseudanabaena sp. PCC 6802 TaxID=118173 RepID=UPI00034D81E4|nr:serine/threonine-protein kinase [Pseudanabaena sp. PCC 6802]
MALSYEKKPSRYRILGLVGRGQFGRVFCARNRKTGQIVALKELEQQKFPTSKFLRELRFLLSLEHENIVSCMALEHKSHKRYLVMDYCEAGTLRDLMNRQGYLAPREIVPLVLDILSGLEHAHNSNIIHCDLKPENVLLKLTPSGIQAKLSDFGIARLTQEITTMDSNNTGSPGYMAPERFYGQFSIASDLYAVGIILYELLLMARPFSGKPNDLRAAHINQRPRMPEGMPEALKAILTRSLEKLPSKRFASATQMRQELVAACNSLDIDRLDLSASIDPEELHPPISEIELSKAGECVKEYLLPGRVGSLATNEYHLFSSSNRQVKRQLISSLGQTEVIAEFESEVLEVVSTATLLFVVTERGIYALSADGAIAKSDDAKGNPISGSIGSRFQWAISPQGNWMATAFQDSLELRNLVHPKVTKLEFGDRAISAIAPLDRHHLVAIVSQTDSKESQIVLISRRGNVMWQVTLPSTVSRAVLSKVANRLLLIDGLSSERLMLVDLKPYRIHRIELAEQPGAIAATLWGYVIASTGTNSTSAQTPSSTVNLFDFEGMCVGKLIVDGQVTAIAPLNINTLAIAIERIDKHESEHKLYVVDLSKLDLDLIF